MSAYPDENTWWASFEAQCQALYAQAGQSVNWSAFRWAARTAYDIAGGMSPDASAAKHLSELRTALNLPGSVVKEPLQPLPPPPSRSDILKVNITFQGLVVPTEQFGTLPGFEACLPWLQPSDRQAYYQQKDEAGDDHALVVLPDGVPVYDEPDQAYSPDRFGPLDWTNGNTLIDPQFPALLREVIARYPKGILLYLGGDGPQNSDIAFTQLDLLHANDDYRNTLYRYCVVQPGWDGVFYGWDIATIVAWGKKFRSLFPDGHAGLHYSTGHIPLGEGGGDFQPGGRMQDFDLLLGEFDDQVHQDSTWQILNRLEANYKRPSDQPGVDDPNRVYYLSVPNPRGEWGHCVLEFGEYQAVRCGTDFAGMVAHVTANRQYMRSMGVGFTG